MKLRRYPKRWANKIPQNPTKQEFMDAWEIVFETHIMECHSISIYASEDFKSINISVYTPTTSILHGGFGYHTLTPNTNKFYYEGAGPDWGVDKDDNRYYYIDRLTMKPTNWHKNKAIQTIRNYITNPDIIESINEGRFNDMFEKPLKF